MRCASERATGRARTGSSGVGRAGAAWRGLARERRAMPGWCGVLLAAACGLAAGVAAAAPPTAVEYYQDAYGHFFVTATPAEIAALDGGTPPGWNRTGQSFEVLPLGTAGAASVCRFWSDQTWKPKSSHFYTPYASECAKVKGNPDWKYEEEAFALTLPDATGKCVESSAPLYRLYNDGKGGAPNHRYTTSLAIRSQMLAQGWLPEGLGIGVIGCVPAQAGVSVVAAGDIGQCFGRPAATSGAARTAALVRDSDALVLTLGDNVYENGTAEEFANCFDPTWGAFKDRIHPAPGNHDFNTPGAGPYFDYFGAKAGPDRRGWYSFDFGGWHFISLNGVADVGRGSEQYRWVEADLAQSRDALCTIAVLHYPAFNSGGNYGSVLAMRPMFDLLQSAGVEMLLSGHEHIYERFAPQRADGTADPSRGMRQFVVGTGGHELNPLGPPVANSEFRTNATWGVLRLRLLDGSYGWQFVPVGGSAPVDAGAANCHR